MQEIFKSGYSRIPICGHEGTNDIIGLMLVKDLIFIDPDDNTPISNFMQIFGRSVQTGKT
jgi:metal transporter CNNM